LSLSGLSKRIFALGAVVAFASNWAAYQTVVVNFVYGGAEQLASVLAGVAHGPTTSVTPGIVARLDAVFEAITDLASNWSYKTPLDQAQPPPTVENFAEAATNPTLPPAANAQAQPPTPGATSAINMLWFSAMALALGSAGVLVITKILLGFLLALGPVFILLALFPATRGLFEGWLRAVAANAFTPVFALLGTAGALGVVEPIIQSIALDQQNGITDVEPVFVLAMASLIFGMLMAMALATTAKLASAWRLPIGGQEKAPVAIDAPSAAALAPGANARIQEIVAAAANGASAAPVSAPDDRRSIGSQIVLAPALEDRRESEDFARRTPRRAYRGFGAARLSRGRV
jgi:type IV secretion system protein VirB6